MAGSSCQIYEGVIMVLHTSVLIRPSFGAGPPFSAGEAWGTTNLIFWFVQVPSRQPHSVLEFWSNVIPIWENTSNHKLQRRLDSMDTSIILNPKIGFLCWVLLVFILPGLLPGTTDPELIRSPSPTLQGGAPKPSKLFQIRQFNKRVISS